MYQMTFKLGLFSRHKAEIAALFERAKVFSNKSFVYDQRWGAFVAECEEEAILVALSDCIPERFKSFDNPCIFPMFEDVKYADDEKIEKEVK
jgi:hypothetical protein